MRSAAPRGDRRGCSSSPAGRRKADLIAELGVEELVVILRPRVGVPVGPAVRRRRRRRGAGGHAGVGGRQLPLRHKAGGDAAMLEAIRASTTRVVEMVELDGETVSSTHIRGSSWPARSTRRRASSRAVPDARSGRPWDKRGRELGFPTANVVPRRRLAYPGHGVYAALAGSRRRGTRPARGGQTSASRRRSRPVAALLVDPYLLDFRRRIYDSRAAARLPRRYAREKAFPSAESSSSRCTAM